MQRDLSCSLILLGIGLTSSACVRPYHAPTPDEPHAVVKIRRSYDDTPGTKLTEVLDLGEYRAFESNTSSGEGKAARTDVVLVHPGPVVARVETKFFHQEMRNVQETYTERVPHYTTETYDCSTGFGTSRSYRTCTRPKTEYRTETKRRWVTKAVDVTDGSCNRSIRFAPADRHVYLLQYSYQDNGVCALTCFEQIFSAQGSFRTAACAAAPPADD